MNILTKFSLRHARLRPMRSLLTLFSIVLGVALVVSVSIATATTRRAYFELFSTVTGKTALEIVATGGGLFDGKVLADIEKSPGVRAAAPTMQRPTILYHGRGNLKLLTLAIDPKRDAAIRDYKIVPGGRAFEPREAGMLMEADFARNLGMKVGDKAKFYCDGVREVTLVGLIATEGSDTMRLAGVALLPLERVQLWARAKGKVESIQVVLDDNADEQVVQSQLSATLPEGLVARRPSIRTQVMDEQMNASQQALRWTMLITIFLGVFIILNTFLMSVGERRHQFAVMRCVGATRGQIAQMIVFETLVMGLVGTLIGIGLGLLGAYWLAFGMSQLMQIGQPPMNVSWWTIAIAFSIGPSLALVGAIIPAWRASQCSPLEGLSALTQADKTGIPWSITLSGVALVIAGTVVLVFSLGGWLHIDFSLGAAVALFFGGVLIVPELLPGLSQLITWVVEPILQTKARLAHRQVLRHRVRTALTIGVLFVASGAGLGLANSILDNVTDVREWYRRTLVAHFFIRAMMPDMSGAESANIQPEMGDEIRQIPGVANVGEAKFIQAIAGGKPASADGRQPAIEGKQASIIIRDFRRDQRLSIDLRDASGGPVSEERRSAVRDELFEGGVIVGTVLAQKINLNVGDKIGIETRRGLKDLPIAALSNEYLVGGLVIYMERDTAKRLFNIEGVDAYIVNAEEGRLDEVREKLQPLCEKYGVLLHSFADIERLISGMVRGIEVGLWATIVVCFFVAAIGVVNTLTINVLEQTRELGLLRIVAMTRGQVRATIFAQAGIIGIIGLGVGTLVGILLAYLMHLAMMQSIGHPVPFVFRPGLYLGTFFIGLAIVLLASWFPAERAVRLELRDALQYE